MDKRALILFLLVGLTFSGSAPSQFIQVLGKEDFDLRGPVKSAEVLTSYGKETYEFNEQGLLTKSVTEFNETDYEVVYYKYGVKGNLQEKRSESYRNGTFDPATSIAHFYEVQEGSGQDSAATKKITERVISYDRSFQEQYVYAYGADGNLNGFVRLNDEGKDEMSLEHKRENGETTVTHLWNDVPTKLVRTSKKKTKTGAVRHVKLTKKYIEGVPEEAVEEVTGEDGLILERQLFHWDPEKKSFVPTVKTTFEYDEGDRLVLEVSKKGKVTTEKKFMYQFDGSVPQNWIKKIETPENSYVTRKISYYAPAPTEDQK
ncbi:hypothetical protein [Maribacter sp. 2307ULW6-5]|uniref:hypothetical protein n=1 Tax=Maribacter sp. 2307ULW6-5 TaxID=3386275 RepID=UPI0039BCF1E4